jgi:hypothetical protein
METDRKSPELDGLCFTDPPLNGLVEMLDEKQVVL